MEHVLKVAAFAALISIIRLMIRRDLRAELDRRFPTQP